MASVCLIIEWFEAIAFYFNMHFVMMLFYAPSTRSDMPTNVKAVTAVVNGCCILCDYWQFDMAENRGDQ